MVTTSATRSNPGCYTSTSTLLDNNPLGDLINLIIVGGGECRKTNDGYNVGHTKQSGFLREARRHVQRPNWDIVWLESGTSTAVHLFCSTRLCLGPKTVVRVWHWKGCKRVGHWQPRSVDRYISRCTSECGIFVLTALKQIWNPFRNRCN